MVLLCWNLKKSSSEIEQKHFRVLNMHVLSDYVMAACINYDRETF